MKRFLARYNLVKNSNPSKPFYGSIDHPLPHLSFKIYFNMSSQNVEISSQTALIIGPGHIMKRFGPICTRIYIISATFLRV